MIRFALLVSVLWPVALAGCSTRPPVQEVIALTPPDHIQRRDCSFAEELAKVSGLAPEEREAIIQGTAAALACTTLGSAEDVSDALYRHWKAAQSYHAQGDHLTAALAAMDGAHAARALERDPAGRTRELAAIWESVFLELAADAVAETPSDQLALVAESVGHLENPSVELYPTGPAGEIYRRHRESGYSPHASTPAHLLSAASAGHSQYLAEKQRQRLLEELDRPIDPWDTPDARACDPRVVSKEPSQSLLVTWRGALTARREGDPLTAVAFVAAGVQGARGLQARDLPGDRLLGITWEARLWSSSLEILDELQPSQRPKARLLLDPLLDPGDDVRFDGQGGSVYRANRYGDPLPDHDPDVLRACAEAGILHRDADQALARVAAVLTPEGQDR